MLIFAPPVVADMRLSRPTLRAMTERYPDGFPTLTWVLPGAGLSMDGESRKVAAEITNEYEPSIRAQATLIEGTGFQGAAVRAIVSGIDLMTRSRAPKKVFGEVRPAVDWCLTHRPFRSEPGVPSMLAPDISAALASVRRPFG